MMRKKDFYLSRKRSSKRDNDDHQKKSRPKRRRIESSSTDAIDAEKSKLEQLPSNCLQRIWSFMNYEKMSQMRQVCKIFNATSKTFLDEGHRRLEERLKGEIEKAEKMVLFPTNARSSYDLHRFLKGLHAVINDSTIYYKPHVDYFVAGKLLDEANCLLKDFNSSSGIHYFPEHIYDQKPHPLLGPIIAHSEKAYEHFFFKVLDKFIYYDDNAGFERYMQNELEIELQVKRNKMKIIKANVLKIRWQRIDCGNAMGKEFLKLFSKLNENVVDLTQRTKTMDKELKRVINEEDILNQGQINFLFYLSTSSNLSFKATTTVGIPGLKRPNFSALPLSCIRHIVSNLNCDKMAQLRLVCKSLNKVCKEELNQKMEQLKQKFEFQIKCKEQNEMKRANKCSRATLKINIMKDLCSLLQLCKDTYKCYFGAGYNFIAGKVLDEMERIYNEQIRAHQFLLATLGRRYKSRPHKFLFNLTDLVYKAIAHFKVNIVSKYFPLTQNQDYVSDFLFTNDAMNFEKENPLNLEDIEKLIDKAEGKIKELNDKNRKFLKVISSLKKKMIGLNRKNCERMSTLNELIKN